MKLAIVGSQGKAWTQVRLGMAYGYILGFCRRLEITEVVSGRSPGGGVDQLAEDYATAFDIPFVPFAASTNDWKHFKARNMMIAEYCDELLCIRSFSSETYGSGWTADYAEKIGKTVWRVKF